MPTQMTRRETLMKGLAVTSLLSLVPDWAMPALAQGEAEVPFTDLPKNFPPPAGGPTRMLDIRKIDGMVTPKDQFFALQHFAQPEIDGAAWRLKLSGMVGKPMEMTLAEIKAMKPVVETAAGYECSGNSARSMEGLASSGKWTGVPLNAMLKHVGVHPDASEVVLLGTDRGVRDSVFRTQTFKLNQQFGRSLTIQRAMKPEPLLAYALNGEPLTKAQGFPLRLIMPGWYGVCNVKWVAEIHLQDERYVGEFEARWYRTIRGTGGTGEDSDGSTQWEDNEVTKQNVKSVVARVTKKGSGNEVMGFVLHDGSGVKSVEVKIDDGPWQKASIDESGGKYAWKLFTYKWDNPTAGEHTIVSRATDAAGNVQPEAGPLNKFKKTFLEDNAQFPRKVMVS